MEFGNLSTDQVLDQFMQGFARRNPGEENFQQAVHELAADIVPFMMQHPKYRKMHLLERLTEPDRIITFRVNWVDDHGCIRTNRGYRVQHNNSIGPYKGGLRFHKDVKLDDLKFLAFEQTFKNSLTGLPMGGAKGGSDFNPKGKSDLEIMRFCQAFMTHLYRYIGPHTDVPAGDIGVGSREVSFLYGQFKRMTNELTPVLTGKDLAVGGSLIRMEATGYGAVYMAANMLEAKGESLAGKTAIVSGSGNVAVYASEKLIEKGAKVLTLSDSAGFIFDKDGIDSEKLEWIKELKFERRGRISEYVDQFPNAEYFEGERPWKIQADLAFPCATQNEIDEADAKQMIANGCQLVAEGANMPSNEAAIRVYQDARIMFAPAKAANAGGVAVSGLEMAQNSMRYHWSREEVDTKLQTIMADIHNRMVEYGTEGDYINYQKGANIAGFIKVADAMLALGVI
ncbi:NADP-specific glutamate dehydrogenase [Spongorhabdus nitratireducens]